MIKLHEVHKVYAQGKIGFHALKDISLFFEKGEIVSIFGPSGCGKTTLLNIIGGLDTPTTGEMVIDNKLTTNFIEKEWDYFRNHRIGFIFQSYNLIEHLPIVENVALSIKLSGESHKVSKQKAIELLKKVGLENHLHKLPGQLSGGERQRVSIARALINDPDVILADEPTGALDQKTGNEVMDLIKSICADKLVIIVTHNKKLAKKYSTRMIELKDGKVISDTSPKDKKVDIILDRQKNKKKLKFREALRFSFYNIKGKIWRTLFVALGLSVGVVGLILIDSFFNSIRIGLEQENAILVNNPDVYIYDEYDPSFDPIDYIDTIDDYGYFREVLYTPRNAFSIQRNETLNTDLLYPISNRGIEAPTSRSILDTFTKMIGNSKLPSGDNEIAIHVDYAEQLVSSSLNLTKSELWDEIKGNQYLIYNEFEYYPEEYSMYVKFDNETCIKTEEWDIENGTPPINYDATKLGTITQNMALLSEYRSTPIVSSNGGYIFCEEYDTLGWYQDLSSPKGTGVVVTLVGIYDNDLFTQFILSDNIILAAPYQKEYINPEDEPDSVISSGVRVRAFINTDDIENKAKIITRLESDGYIVLENEGDFGLLGTITTVFMYIIQFIFSSIVSIAIITGGLMLLLILFISIIERKREIGLVRAMGGTRGDVRLIYSSETTIIGLISGFMSVIISIVLIAILNIYIYNNYLETVVQYLPFVDPKEVLTINFSKLVYAIIGSVAIAFISGLIPAVNASRKKPIEALRNE